jgi:hypothetical protein
VIETDVIAGRNWDEVTSSDGVRSYVSRLTKPVLRSGGAE